MAGVTTWPAAKDTFNLPVTGVPLATAPGSAYQVGSGLLAVRALEDWLDAQPVNVVAASTAACVLPDPRIFPMTFVTMSANCAFTLPSAVAGKQFVVFTIQGASPFTGSFTGARWNAGTPPTLSTGVGAVDAYTFVCPSTHWYGGVFGQAMA